MGEYGLLGRKLGHSWSPAIHKQLGSFPYGLYETEPEHLSEFLNTTSLQGMNVTIPYKKDVLTCCTELSEIARKLGSVNTLVRRPEGWYGDNTDYYGFCYMVKTAGISVSGKKAIVLGSGGASVTVVQALLDLGASSVTVISRNGEHNYENLQNHKDAQIIVNTTPVGMYPKNGESPISLDCFPNCLGVLDLIYNPQRTALLIDAQARDIPCCGGLTMLVAQAKRAAEVFMDTTLEEAVIPKITKQLESQMRNIVLIGMPGCGKSTVAQALGAELGMTIVDADVEIEKAAGKSIPDIFRDDGEDVFRKIETQVLSDLGKQTGMILSTGGGCVTREENYPALHQNGFIVWLNRDLEELPTQGRPLSQATKLEEMYRIRKPLYEKFADVSVDNNGTVLETVAAIKEALI